MPAEVTEQLLTRGVGQYRAARQFLAYQIGEIDAAIESGEQAPRKFDLEALVPRGACSPLSMAASISPI